MVARPPNSASGFDAAPVGTNSSWQGLVVSHLSLADAVARRWTRYRALRPYLDDLTQEARVGLILAAHRFRPEFGVAFGTYAWWWMQHCIRRSPLVDLRGAGVSLDVGVLPGTYRGLGELERLVDAKRLASSFKRAVRRHAGSGKARGQSRRDAELFLAAVMLDESFAELARGCGLTRERVRQIHERTALVFDDWRIGILSRDGSRRRAA